MAKNNIPKDVLDDLENSGFTFDENGEIVEDSFIKEDTAKKITPVSEDDNVDENDQQDEDEVLTSTTNDDPDEEEDDIVDPLLTNEPKKLLLTSRDEKLKQSKESDSEQIARLQRSQEELLERVKALSEAKTYSKAEDTTEDEDDLASLRAEAARFRKMRVEAFAKDVEREVNSLALGAEFKEIITSDEWQNYLNSSVLGTVVGTMYIESVKSNDEKTVIDFFKDFSNRYIPSIQNSKKLSPAAARTAVATNKDKPSLDDLAVPNRSKTTTPPRSKKYDYEEDDYIKQLTLAERGKISHQQFNEFDDKFNKALAQGRVKPSNS